MNSFRKFSAAVLCVALTMAIAAGSSQAATIGTIYQNDPTPADASIMPSATLPNATFTTNNIDFDTHIEGSWAAAFLGSIDPTQPGGHLYQTFSNQQNGFDPNAAVSNSFIQFTGSTYLNAGSNVFVVTHQVGVVLTLAGVGTVINQPTSANGTNNPVIATAPSAGYYNFVLNYATGSGPTSFISAQVNGQAIGTPSLAAAPEPASIALLGSGLVAIAALTRRRRSSH